MICSTSTWCRNPVEVERVFADADNSVDDLRQDVERYQHRMALKRPPAFSRTGVVRRAAYRTSMWVRESLFDNLVEQS